jgi:hypothetical protein
VTTTSRVSGPVSSVTTQRLQPVLTQVDPWGGSWGDAWGQSWGVLGYTLGLNAVVTTRVSGNVGSTITKRLD